MTEKEVNMKKLICLTMLCLMLISLYSCVGPDAEDTSNEPEQTNDVIDDAQEYNENPENNEQQEPTYDGAWWTEPFHLRFENKSLVGENEYDEIEVLYDGEEVYLKDAYNIYYVKERGDVTRTYSIYRETVTYTDSEYEEETVEYELENNMAHIPSVIAYIKSVLYVDTDLWEKIGSEEKQSYDCDIYTEITPVLERNKLWIDKDTGILVWREDEPLSLLDDEELSELYGVQYKLISFENENVPKVSDIFNLDDYGGDPEDAKEKGLAEARAYLPEHSVEIIKEDYALYSKMYTVEVKWTLEDTKAYVETLRGAGFSLEEDEYDFGTVYSFVAFDEAGYKVSISWADDDTGSIYLYAPAE